MSRHLMTRLILLLGLMPSIVVAQAPSDPPGRAYKVAFWYELARPFSTTQYRAYDVANGEYNKEAVDRWQRTIFEKYPRMGACVRDLTTAGESGATEAERLASAVEREKRRWADLNKNPVRSLRGVATAPSTVRVKDKEVSRVGFDKPTPGDSGTPLYQTRSPFPYPYRSGPR